ncbi:MAG: TIGR03557 family F420-dependent LLM class oxidoreductase [Actinomycetota bacterium]|nr:TIGR03557 family F420-dependent LLM class oxidoreductase [Actinomycetota bacterium]
MTTFGYTLMTEQRAPDDLVREAQLAEEAGFDFAVMSDHFHPWLESQGNSPFVWSVLGAVAERTQSVGLMTMVTCPIIRYHPAIVAQAAATVAVMSGGRFSLGVGSGENLNEHVVGRGWPPADIRLDMLREAIKIIRLLWGGGAQSYRGQHFRVDDARLYTLPESPPQICVAVSGGLSVTLAAEDADGIVAVEPDGELVSQYKAVGGSGPRYGQIPVCWAEDEASARATARQLWRFGVPGWPVMAELPSPSNFEAATATVREDDVAEMVPCGPDPDRHAAAIGQFVDAGFDHVAVVQCGEDQEGFLRFWQEELRPRLR